MSLIKQEKRENIRIVRLNNGVTNAISPDLVDELGSIIRNTEGECHGMVLAGGQKFFSIGLDLPTILQLSNAAMTDFWFAFDKLSFELFTLPVPTAAALRGHATAGGNVLALMCDYRFAADNNKLIGLNEVKLGAPVPYLSDLVLRQVVGDRYASDMLYTGEFLTFSRANEIGLIDELSAPEDVEEQAIQKVTALAGLNQQAFSEIKANRVETIRLRYEKNSQAKNEAFLACWFSKTTQEVLAKAAEKF